MTEKEQATAAAAAAQQQGQFKASRSAAELAYSETEGYADPGLAEHKDPKHHVEAYWHRGSGGLRPQGHDFEEEEQRLHELEQKGQPGMVRRAMGAVGGALASAAGAVLPGFRVSKSSAELAGTEEYAEEGLAEHKDPKHHLESYWHRGSGGLRAKGHDVEEEAERLRELEARKGGVVESVRQSVASTAAAASEKASEYVQSTKETLGLADPKK